MSNEEIKQLAKEVAREALESLCLKVKIKDFITQDY